jgi:hypothetical protein
MIQVNERQQVVIVTDSYADTHAFTLKAMVRVLGLAMSAEADNSNRDCLKDYCDLLEAMLPNEGQLSIRNEALGITNREGVPSAA